MAVSAMIIKIQIFLSTICTIFLLCLNVEAANTPPPGTNGMIIYNNSNQYGALTVGPTLTISGKTANTTQSNRQVTSTIDTILPSDGGSIIEDNSSSAITTSIAAASTFGFTNGYGLTKTNIGTASDTITPASGNIGIGTTLVIPGGNSGCSFYSVSTGYKIDYSACPAVTTTFGQNVLVPLGSVGIGTNAPLNSLDIKGSVVIGTSYAGVNTAPTSGMLVQGFVDIGTTTAVSGAALTVHGAIAATGNSTNHAVCWKANGILGFCSAVVDSSGLCGTCN